MGSHHLGLMLVEGHHPLSPRLPRVKVVSAVNTSTSILSLGT